MKKTYKLENLDCANCAAKMEETIKKIEGVVSVSVSFMAQKLTLEVVDAQTTEVLEKVVKVLHKVEPDCEIIL